MMAVNDDGNEIGVIIDGDDLLTKIAKARIAKKEPAKKAPAKKAKAKKAPGEE